MPKFRDMVSRVAVSDQTYDHNENKPNWGTTHEVPRRRSNMRVTNAAVRARKRSILQMTARRPMTLTELSRVLGYSADTGAHVLLNGLMNEGLLDKSGRHYFPKQGAIAQQSIAEPTSTEPKRYSNGWRQDLGRLDQKWVEVMQLLDRKDGDVTGSDLGKSTEFSPNSLNYVAGRLEVSGFVTKATNQWGRRIWKPTEKWAEFKKALNNSTPIQTPIQTVQSTPEVEVTVPATEPTVNPLAKIDELYKEYCNDLPNFMSYVQNKR